MREIDCHRLDDIESDIDAATSVVLVGRVEDFRDVAIEGRLASQRLAFTVGAQLLRPIVGEDDEDSDR